MNELKFTEKLLVMKMEKDAKLEKQLTCNFNIDMRTLKILTRAFENLKSLYFNGLPLTKVYNV